MNHLSEIERIIRALSASSEILEPAVYEDVCQFIRQSQTESGAFADRGGQPDWYYSLFGYMICQALNLQNESNKLGEFVMNSGQPSKKNRVEWSAWIILRDSFNPRLLFKVRASFQLVSGWMKYRNSTDRVYQIFLTLLIFDHFWGFPRLLIHKIDQLTSAFPLNCNSPTPHLASVMCIRNRGHLDVDDLATMLINNVHPEGGFVSFHDQPQADLLSTAVAAYALSQSPAGISQLAADGLGFVSSNFDRGAFLSGNGDPIRDVEYTFYGLLALSAYAQSLTETQESAP